ncbi:putative glutathione S-transferase, Thioredoxin-like superfamily, glutathione Transferase family [Septoria linicola]|nr:putative glutathione S-transferase, Thioredoxin-like superfamily, glutathione Transferase family [Septoria linicola]
MSSIKPLTLHAHGTGPNPYKVAAALEFLGLPYEVKLWQFGDARNGVKGPAFLKINENGRVPALEDPNTGVTSWESGAVLNYNKLGPRGSSEQDIVDFEKWEYFLLSTLGPMMGQVNWFRHYHSQKNDDALKRYEEQAYRCFGVLDGQLKKHGGPFILPGSTPSAVDLHFYPWVYQHEFAGLSMDSYSNIKKWLEQVSSLPEIKAAYEKVPKGKDA